MTPHPHQHFTVLMCLMLTILLGVCLIVFIGLSLMTKDIGHLFMLTSMRLLIGHCLSFYKLFVVSVICNTSQSTDLFHIFLNLFLNVSLLYMLLQFFYFIFNCLLLMFANICKPTLVFFSKFRGNIMYLE